MTREEALIQLRLGPGINEDVSEEYNEAVDMAIKAIKTIPSEGEQIIKVSKGTLKARTGRYVVYDVEWLKEHFNTTEAKIYGQPSEDCISRQAVLEITAETGALETQTRVKALPSVTPQPKTEPQQKTGHWIEHKHGGIEHIECSECGVWFLKADLPRKSYCPNCGSCNGDMIKNIMRDITKK